MNQTYAASPQLERFITERAPLHHPSDEAPDSYDALCAWYENNIGDSVPVFRGGSEKTMYSGPEVNWAARAWHDELHYKLGTDFSLGGEVRVARVQLDEMYEAYEEFEFTAEDFAAVWADVIGQCVYYAERGECVEDQQAFVDYCVKFGINETLDLEVAF